MQPAMSVARSGRPQRARPYFDKSGAPREDCVEARELV
jgi:hypothetical protein